MQEDVVFGPGKSLRSAAPDGGSKKREPQSTVYI